MKLRFSLHAIPLSLAAIGLWALVGGCYVPLVPANLSGPDNSGIVLSSLGACLFLADRLAYYRLKADCWLILFKLWLWGVLFIAWGLLEWVTALNGKHWLVFIAHWLSVAALIMTGTLLARRRSEG